MIDIVRDVRVAILHAIRKTPPARALDCPVLGDESSIRMEVHVTGGACKPSADPILDSEATQPKAPRPGMRDPAKQAAVTVLRAAHANLIRVILYRKT